MFFDCMAVFPVWTELTRDSSGGVRRRCGRRAESTRRARCRAAFGGARDRLSRAYRDVKVLCGVLRTPVFARRMVGRAVSGDGRPGNGAFSMVHRYR